MRRTAIFLALPLAACVAAPPHAGLAQPQPRFDPLAFFAGRTEGRAVLRKLFSASEPVTVHGTGHVAPDGTLVLDQEVLEGTKPASHREWRIRAVAPDRYAGTLTDATGPVTGEVAGNRLHLAFTIKGGFRVDQWLYLQPGGRAALNRLTVRKFGLRVATLAETIAKRP